MSCPQITEKSSRHHYTKCGPLVYVSCISLCSLCSLCSLYLCMWRYISPFFHMISKQHIILKVLSSRPPFFFCFLRSLLDSLFQCALSIPRLDELVPVGAMAAEELLLSRYLLSGDPLTTAVDFAATLETCQVPEDAAETCLTLLHELGCCIPGDTVRLQWASCMLSCPWVHRCLSLLCSWATRHVRDTPGLMHAKDVLSLWSPSKVHSFVRKARHLPAPYTAALPSLLPSPPSSPRSSDGIPKPPAPIYSSFCGSSSNSLLCSSSSGALSSPQASPPTSPRGLVGAAMATAGVASFGGVGGAGGAGVSAGGQSPASPEGLSVSSPAAVNIASTSASPREDSPLIRATNLTGSTTTTSVATTNPTSRSSGAKRTATPLSPPQLLLRLLESSDLCVRLRSRGLVLFPCLLPSQRPKFDDLWPSSDPSRMQYSRYYYLEQPGVLLKVLPRLLMRSLELGWSLERAWSQGMLMRHKGETLLAEGFRSTCTLKVHIRAQGSPRIMTSLLASLHTLASDWLHVSMKVEVPCIHCIRERSYDPYKFSLEQLQEAASEGRSVVWCRSVNPIQLLSIAPDLCLRGLNVKTVPYSDMDLDPEPIGIGGYAKVNPSHHVAMHRQWCDD